MKLYIFVTNSSVYAWQFNMLERLVSAEGISEVYIVLTSSHNGHSVPKNPTLFKLPLLVSFLYKIDSLLTKCHLDTLEPKNINDLSTTSSTISITELSRETYLQNMKNQSHSSVIAVNCQEQWLDDEIILNTPVDIFSVFIGEDKRVYSPLTGVFEFIAGGKTISSGIQIEKPQSENNQIIFSSTTSIESPSLCRTIESCLNKTSVFLERTVRNFNANPELLNQFSQTGNLKKTPVKKLYNKFSMSQTFTLYANFMFRVAKRVYEKFTITEQWILLLGINEKSDRPHLSLDSYTKIIPPKDEFWADPFLFEHEDKHYLFIEVFPYERDLGHLSCMEVLEDGSYAEPVKILERPYHLSYPNVFEYENEFYMIPETGDNQTIELYKATSFPYEWKFVHKMMDDIRAYDSTLYFHNGLWWLFATVSEDEKCPTTEELYLFYSDSPISDNWTAHANNPVISDAASARPAGKIYVEDNKIIRPSQNCAGSYGAGLNLCEIETLDTETYKEKTIASFSPDWDPKLSGLHTLNFDSKFSVSDAILKRSKRS